MRCPQCHAEVHQENRFCASCGAMLVVPPPGAREARLARLCAQCGQALDPQDNFCGFCGAEATANRTVPLIQSQAGAAARTEARRAPSHRIALVLAYLNVFISLAVIAFAHTIVLGGNYEGASDAFSDLYPFKITRYALLSLVVGTLAFATYLWTRKTRRARWQSVLLVFISLVVMAAGVMVFA